MTKNNKKNVVTVVVMVIITAIYFWIFTNKYTFVRTDQLADSTLQVKIAMSISKGHWLGKYNQYLLTKGLSFPFFLVVINKLKLSFSLAIAIFNYLAVEIAMLVFVPYCKKYRRIMFIIFSSLLLFNPVLFSFDLAIPYRDATAYGSIIFVIVWILGMVLNLSIKMYPYSLLLSIFSGTFGLTYWINLREDSAWIYPLLIVAFVVAVIFLVIKKKYASLVILLMGIILPAGGLFAENSYISGKNLEYYGRSVVNEYKSKDFKEAIGTMSEIHTDNWVINVPVNTDVRSKLYKYVPAFKKLKPYLDDGNKNGFDFFKNLGNPEPSLGNDYQGGWFPWAYRGAVYKAGYANNSAEFKKYNTTLVKEIIAANKKGYISGADKPRASLVAPFDKRIIKPVIYDSVNITKVFLGYKGLKFNIPMKNEKQGSKEFNSLAHYLRARWPKNPENSPINSVVLGKYTNFYSVILIVGAILATVNLIVYLFARLRSRKYFLMIGNDWILLGAFGMFLSVLLRLVMLGYVTATSFNAYSMAYMASAYPILLIGIMLSLFLLFKDKLS